MNIVLYVNGSIFNTVVMMVGNSFQVVTMLHNIYAPKYLDVVGMKIFYIKERVLVNQYILHAVLEMATKVFVRVYMDVIGALVGSMVGLMDLAD
jgi:hypothetical protein